MLVFNFLILLLMIRNLTFAFSPGIYRIRCSKNGFVYIGKSANGLTRLGTKCLDLTLPRHDGFEWQSEAYLFGDCAFKFEVLNHGLAYKDKA